MNITTVQTITIILSLISTTIAICLGVGGYVLKVLAERRLQDSNLSEIDVNLSTLFTNLVNVAHARSKNSDGGVGHSSQVAAIISLGELGNRYGILYEPAKAALTSINIWLVDFAPKGNKPDEEALAQDRDKAVKRALVILELPKKASKIKKIIAREGLVLLLFLLASYLIYQSANAIGNLFVKIRFNHLTNSETDIYLRSNIQYYYCCNVERFSYLLYPLHWLIRFIIWAIRILREGK